MKDAGDRLAAIADYNVVTDPLTRHCIAARIAEGDQPAAADLDDALPDVITSCEAHVALADDFALGQVGVSEPTQSQLDCLASAFAALSPTAVAGLPTLIIETEATTPEAAAAREALADLLSACGIEAS
jgi:hypothetical protein